MITFKDGVNGSILVIQGSEQIGVIRYLEETFFFKPMLYVYYELETIKAIMGKLEGLNGERL